MEDHDFFIKLAKKLGNDELVRSDDPEDQARSSLRHLFELVVAGRSTFCFEAVKTKPSECPNCGVEVSSTRSPYCSERCRSLAAFVRQTRAALAARTIFDAEKQIGLSQAFWSLLGGGFPARERQIPEATKKAVMKRDGAKCVLCGGVASAVEHVRTSCNRAINLRAVCANCSGTKPFEDTRFLSEPSCAALLNEFAVRVCSPTPLRCCDDAENWDWRSYISVRKSAGS